MMKYSVAVIAGGTIVWPQMRTMRLNSRKTMVRNPTQRRSATVAGLLPSATPSATPPCQPATTSSWSSISSRSCSFSVIKKKEDHSSILLNH